MVDRKYCSKCKYRVKTSKSYVCQYILITGKMIGDKRHKDGTCQFYEKGKPVKICG